MPARAQAPSKLEWSDTALKLYDHVAAVAPLGWLVAKHTTAARRLKRLIKQNPQLFGLFSRARSAVGALRAPRQRVQVADDANAAEEHIQR